MVFKLDTNYETDKNFKVFQDILRNYGIWINLLRVRRNGRIQETLIISYDVGRYKKVHARGAGRKITRFNMYLHGITIQNIRDMQKIMTNKSIYEKLDMSKATFYRYLKYHKERKSKGTDNFMFI